MKYMTALLLATTLGFHAMSHADELATVPQATRTHEGELNSVQLNQAQQFAQQVATLLGGMTEDTSALRILHEGMRTNSRGSDSYRLALGNTLAEQLDPIVANNDLLPAARINALVFLASVPSPAGMQVAISHKESEEFGVRYWAARTIESGMEQGMQSAVDTGDIVEWIEDEAQGQIASRLLMALSFPGGRENFAVFLNAYAARLAWHQQEPSASWANDKQAVMNFYAALIRAANTDDLRVKALGLFAANYAQLVEECRSVSDREDRFDLLRLVDSGLQDLSKEQGYQGSTPGTVGSFINQEDWDTLSDNAARWRDILSAEPFNLTF